MSKAEKRNEVLFMAGLMGLFAVAATIHSTIGVMLSFYIDDYGLTAARQGLPGTAESIGFIASLFIMAVMLKQLTKIRVLLYSAAGLAIILPMIGLKPPYFILLFLCYALFGISYGIFDSLSSSLMSDLFPGSSAKKMSYMRAVYCFGGMAAPVIQNVLLKRQIGWNRVILILGLAGTGIFAFYLCVSAKKIPGSGENRKSGEKLTLSGFISFVKTPGVPRALLFGIVYYGHQIGLTMWIVRYISNYLNEPEWGSYALTCYWIGALLSRIFLPQFVSSQKKLMLYGNATSMICLTAGIIYGNGKVLCVLVLLAGFAEGTTIPMLVDYVCSFDRKKSATACSAVVFFNNLGSMVIPSAIGALIDASGADAGIFILPVTSLICCLLAIRMKNST